MKTQRTEESQLQRAAMPHRSFSTQLDRQFREADRLARWGRYYESLLLAEEIEAGDHRKLCHVDDHSGCGDRIGVFRIRITVKETVTL